MHFIIKKERDYYNKIRYELNISCQKSWQEYRYKPKVMSEVIWNYNDCIFLSLSKKALQEKAEEIKLQWLEEEYENIKRIAMLEVK